MLEEINNFLKKNWIPVFFLVLAGVLSVLFYLRNKNYPSYLIVSQKAKFKIEKADSFEERYKGLSFRKKICNDCGMFFIMPETKKYFFSMRNMQFDLDFIWIKDNRIVGIDKNISHNSSDKIFSKVPVNFVLEVPAGVSANKNIEIGDKIFFID